MPDLPCDEGNPIFRKWKNGIEKGDPDDTITCEIRNKNMLSEYVPGTHGKKGTVKAPKWNYCYVITVYFDDKNKTHKTFKANPSAARQATGGNGCGSCHTDTGFQPSFCSELIDSPGYHGEFSAMTRAEFFLKNFFNSPNMGPKYHFRRIP